MARLTDHGRRSLRQLFDYEDGELTAAFDKLLDVPGLWSGMRISTLHKLLDMKCYEVSFLLLRTCLTLLKNILIH